MEQLPCGAVAQDIKQNKTKNPAQHVQPNYVLNVH